MIDSMTMARGDLAVTRQGIYYIAGNPALSEPNSWSLVWYDFATGRNPNLATVIPGSSSGLTVSPDGRFVLYTQADRETDDLMLVENFH